MSLNIESTTVKKLAETEGVEEEFIKKGLKNGYIVLLQNVAREDVKICGIGLGLHTKVNANLGTSADLIDPVLEKEKAKVAVKSGADSIMDLSSAGSLDEIRRMILKTVKVPLGTVPVYQAALEAREQKDAIINMDEDDIFRSIEKHVKDGVDFITVHCGVTKNTVEEIIKRGRLMGIVSRGGAFHAATIIHTGEENPLYKNYDYLLEICKEYNTTLSLGDGIRPGCLEDANDSPQIAEMLVISELVERARKSGVQAMVEGPGHIPLHEVEPIVKMYKASCKNAPLYLLGPLVTDIAAGYDHIAGGIGGAIAAAAGADFLCVITPSEHLGLPGAEEIKEGVIAAKIAAHAADIVKLGKKASKLDKRMSIARANLNWKTQLKLALDPEKARKIHENIKAEHDPETCSMCGDVCAIKLLSEKLTRKKE